MRCCQVRISQRPAVTRSCVFLSAVARSFAFLHDIGHQVMCFFVSGCPLICFLQFGQRLPGHVFLCQRLPAHLLLHTSISGHQVMCFSVSDCHLIRNMISGHPVIRLFLSGRPLICNMVSGHPVMRLFLSGRPLTCFSVNGNLVVCLCVSTVSRSFVHGQRSIPPPHHLLVCRLSDNVSFGERPPAISYSGHWFVHVGPPLACRSIVRQCVVWLAVARNFVFRALVRTCGRAFHQRFIARCSVVFD